MTVQKNLISEFNLTLLANTIENLVIISSPILNMKVGMDILSSGIISGRIVSLDSTNITNNKEGHLTNTDYLDIRTQKILRDKSSIRA